ncbi:TKL protein kinase [Thecamonas trahens ATCC 50062]|uniref:TKL protein kinase n=1 Tax=Thecamonas trahens ATCC 50062 TaxID=461836 RepID=A0A0L0DJS3_THETB|nr:TKL protein kinase [Thecamonas trahens ATCC 50062]KNC51543.1 TKL protein kinase [Thecamonas trahens ATCC 50062]|eukprot:XP_013755945.1 TKL protein kinase [Thecamonas trahens ATCC 50062]
MNAALERAQLEIRLESLRNVTPYVLHMVLSLLELELAAVAVSEIRAGNVAVNGKRLSRPLSRVQSETSPLTFSESFVPTPGPLISFLDARHEGSIERPAGPAAATSPPPLASGARDSTRNLWATSPKAPVESPDSTSGVTSEADLVPPLTGTHPLLVSVLTAERYPALAPLLCDEKGSASEPSSARGTRKIEYAPQTSARSAASEIFSFNASQGSIALQCSGSTGLLGSMAEHSSNLDNTMGLVVNVDDVHCAPPHTMFSATTPELSASQREKAHRTVETPPPPAGHLRHIWQLGSAMSLVAYRYILATGMPTEERSTYIWSLEEFDLAENQLFHFLLTVQAHYEGYMGQFLVSHTSPLFAELLAPALVSQSQAGARPSGSDTADGLSSSEPQKPGSTLTPGNACTSGETSSDSDETRLVASETDEGSATDTIGEPGSRTRGKSPLKRVRRNTVSTIPRATPPQRLSGRHAWMASSSSSSSSPTRGPRDSDESHSASSVPSPRSATFSASVERSSTESRTDSASSSDTCVVDSSASTDSSWSSMTTVTDRPLENDVIRASEYYTLSFMTFKVTMASWVVSTLDTAGVTLPFPGVVNYLLDAPVDPLRNAWIVRLMAEAKLSEALAAKSDALPELARPEPVSVLAASHVAQDEEAMAVVARRARAEVRAMCTTLCGLFELGVEPIDGSVRREWRFDESWMRYDPRLRAFKPEADPAMPVWSATGDDSKFISPRLTSRLPLFLFQALACVARAADEGYWLPPRVYCFVGSDGGDTALVTSERGRENRLPLMVTLTDEETGLSFDIRTKRAVLSREVRSSADRARAKRSMAQRGIDLSSYEWIDVKLGLLSVPHVGFVYHPVRQRFMIRNVNSWHANDTFYGGLKLADAERLVKDADDLLALELVSGKALVVKAGADDAQGGVVSFRVTFEQGVRSHLDTAERLASKPGQVARLQIGPDPPSRLLACVLALAQNAFIDAVWAAEWQKLLPLVADVAPYAELVPRLAPELRMADLVPSAELRESQTLSWAVSGYLDDGVADVPEPLRSRAQAVLVFLHLQRVGLQAAHDGREQGSMVRSSGVGALSVSMPTSVGDQTASDMMVMQRTNDGAPQRQSQWRGNSMSSSLELLEVEKESTRLFALFAFATKVQAQHVALGVLWRLLQVVNVENNGLAGKKKTPGELRVKLFGKSLVSGAACGGRGKAGGRVPSPSQAPVVTLDAKSDRMAKLKARRAARAKERKESERASRGHDGVQLSAALAASNGVSPSGPAPVAGAVGPVVLGSSLLDSAKMAASVRFFSEGRFGGETVLHHAVRGQMIDVVHYILALGIVSVKERNNSGFTALYTAAMLGNTRLSAMLLLAGSRVDEACGLNHETTILHEVAQANLLEIMALIVELTDDTKYGVLDAHGRTALQLAGSVEMTNVLKAMTPQLPPNFNVIDFSEVLIGPRLGEGGFCTVYAGKYSGWEVAVKQMKVTVDEQLRDPEMTTTFIREIGFLTKLVHPNVVRLYGVSQGEKPARWHIVTELCENGTLARLLDRAATLAWSTLHMVAMDVVRAMAYLHTRAPVVFHCDIKPSNILLDRSLRARLSDFGLSREDEAADDKAQPSQSLVGTVRYIAPEVMSNGVGSYSRKADVFSFGVMLWEMMFAYVHGTHILPYDTMSGPSAPDAPKPAGEGATLDSHLVLLISTNEVVLDMSGLPKGAVELLQKLIHPSPSVRPLFSELGDMLAAVENVRRL